MSIFTKNFYSAFSCTIILKISCFIAAIILAGTAKGQQYVTSASSSLSGASGYAEVSNKDYVTGAPDNNYASLKAEGIVVDLGGLGTITYAGVASLTVNFPESIPAGKKAYIRISTPEKSGLSLDLSQLVNILGLFTNKTVDVTTNTGTAQSMLVKDEEGNLHIAVSSTAAFTSAVIKLDFSQSVGGLIGFGLGSISMKVYHGVTYENSSFTPCEASEIAYASVNPEATGISLTLTQALQEPEKAIDGVVNASNYTLLQNGTVAAVSSVQLSVNLGKGALATNEIIAVISKPAALVNVGVLDNITIQAYLGNAPVGPLRTISSLLLELDLLGLFSNNSLARLYFKPNVEHDRVVIKSNTLLNANLFTGLQIHEIASRPPVVLTGGAFSSVTAGEALGGENVSSVTGSGIVCGTFSDYSFRLFNVTPAARVAAGTLPGTLTLTPSGILQGTTSSSDEGEYEFDIEAINNNTGQRGVGRFSLRIAGSLPVKLTNFTVKKEGATAQLTWATTEEVNSQSFDVERSSNGKQWNRIGIKKSNGESASIIRYSFTDTNPANGENLYRLKMIDRDGTFAYSGIESATFNKELISLYPNPVIGSESLSIQVGDWSNVKTVKVISAAGKVVFESAGKTVSSILTNQFTAGLYVVQITHKNGQIVTSRFVKM
jgi:hypothetical protein